MPFPGRLVATDFAASVGFLEHIQRRFLFEAGFGLALAGGFAEQILQQGGLSSAGEMGFIHVVPDRASQGKPIQPTPASTSHSLLAHSTIEMPESNSNVRHSFANQGAILAGTDLNK